MTQIKGTISVSTGNIGSTVNQRDVMARLCREWPDLTPLIYLANREGAKTRTITNYKYEHFEESAMVDYDLVNGAKSTTAPAIVVDDGSWFTVRDIITVGLAEQMLVTAVSTNTLTVTRGFGETTARTVADNAEVEILGSAYAEGADNTNLNLPQWTNDYNYSQCFRELVAVTRRQQKHKPYTGDARTTFRKSKLNMMLQKMEKQFLFGERYVDDATGNTPTTATRGITNFITNTANAAGAFTESWFGRNALKTVFNYGSDEKIAFMSDLGVQLMAEWGINRLRGAEADSERLGLKGLMAYESAHGRLLIKKHRLLRNTTPNGYVIIVDPNHFRLAVMDPLHLETDLEYGNQHKKVDEWVADCGPDFDIAKAHYLVTGATG